jgi:hypothetical protein
MSPTNVIQDKTIYYKYCAEDFEYNVYSCPGKTGVINIEYKIFVDKQIVISKNGYANKSCVVFDKNNWECDKGQQQTIRMSDGDIYESNEGSIDKNGQKSTLPRYLQITALEYYIHSVIIFFRNFF